MPTKNYFAGSFLLMFFILSKLLDFLLKPIVWILVALAVALLVRQPQKRKTILIWITAILIFFSNPFFSNEALLQWETPAMPISSLPYHDVGIILTGVTDGQQPLQDRTYTKKGADRILHAITLFRKGKIGRILVSGGDGTVGGAEVSEAAGIRAVLLQAQVPDSLIILEENSRNTFENARFSAAVLQQHPHLKTKVLITSAFHMRRARGCFEKAGITATPFSTDFYSMPRQWKPDRWLVPTEESLSNWTLLIHEWTGYLLYKLNGYL